MPQMGDDRLAALRLLPSVDQVLERVGAQPFPQLPRARLAELVRELLAEWRTDLASGRLTPEALEAALAPDELMAAVRARIEVEIAPGVVPAVNATGVVLHTGLGRAPVHPEAAQAMALAARSYCVLEIDRASGERGHRDGHLSSMIARLCGAEAGTAVNNCAGAVLLVLNTYGAGREVLVSRGELVEIGGSFRMPDIMARAGARLREVGTTNRTHMSDYRAAIGPETGLLLKVHTSNFRVQGFVSEVSAAELAALGRARGLPSAFDLGSGLAECAGATPLDLPGEPRVLDSLESGMDLVLFSGDKLLGGPQAGLIAGKRAAIEKLRANPLYRALRLDKVTLAGLEATLSLLLAGRGDEIPTRALLRRSAEELAARAGGLARRLSGVSGLQVEVREGHSQPGSGSAPLVWLATTLVALRPARGGVDALARALRFARPPVFARIQDDALLLDPRTLLPGDEDLVERALHAWAGAEEGP
jgi:L-seryl-tRNA(Ser) seleniumtransferase